MSSSSGKGECRTSQSFSKWKEQSFSKWENEGDLILDALNVSIPGTKMFGTVSFRFQYDLCHTLAEKCTVGAIFVVLCRFLKSCWRWDSCAMNSNSYTAGVVSVMYCCVGFGIVCIMLRTGIFSVICCILCRIGKKF